MEESQKSYYEKLNSKLNNPKTSPKAYWSILKSLYCDKKIPVIPPIFYNNTFITKFNEKANLFNNFFAKQCSLLQNNSTLPEHLSLPTPAILNNVAFNENDILQYIRRLDPNKSHGFDGISNDGIYNVEIM